MRKETVFACLYSLGGSTSEDSPERVKVRWRKR